MVAHYLVCGSSVKLGHIHNIMIDNDKLIKPVRNVHMNDRVISTYKGKLRFMIDNDKLIKRIRNIHMNDRVISTYRGNLRQFIYGH